MDKKQLIAYLEQIDRNLEQPAILYIYGSAACILMDEPGRTSLDIDVAAPYSDADYGDLVHAAQAADLPVNPEEDTAGNHIEWIQSLFQKLKMPSSAYRPRSTGICW